MSEDQQAQDHQNAGVLTDPVASMQCEHCKKDIDVSEVPPFTRIHCPHCEGENTAPARLGSFLLLRLIGTGGMGGVYLARDESLGRNVAIKVMLASYGEDEAFIENFKREAQAQARLNHPHVGQIYSFGQEKGQPYIVMELISGKAFEHMVRGDQRLHQGLVMRIGADIAEGLRAADEAGLLHGDIKPENILLDEKGQAKLVDFGIASFAHQSNDGGVWGTPYYIAPEKIQRRKADARSDIYSLGATLFHALTGRPPFEGETPIDVVKARLNQPAPHVAEYRKDIDPEVDRIVARMLETEPSRRHPTYASLISDLRKAADRLGGGKKTGRVVLTRKGGTASTGQTTTGSLGEAAGGPRITIKKPRTLVAGGALADYRNKNLNLSEEPAGPTPEQLARRKKARKTSLLVFVLLLALAGITGGVLYLKHQRDLQIEQRREAFALATAKENAADVLKEIGQAYTGVVRQVSAKAMYVTLATNAVALALGEDPRAFLRSVQRPDEDTPPAPQPEPVAPEPTEPAAPDVAPPPPAAEPAPRPAGVPEGMPTREELDRRRRGTPAPEAPPAPAPEAAEPTEPEAPPAPPPVAPAEPEIMQQARKVLVSALAVEDLLAHADVALAEATNLYAVVQRATTSGAAQKTLTAMREIREQLGILTEEAKDRERQLKAEAKDVSETVARLEAEREAARQRQEEEARRREEEERQRREEAERQARIQGELDQVSALHAEAKAALRTHAYDGAADRVALRDRVLRTDEGLAALKVIVERYRRLESLKNFLIQTVSPEHKHSRGWIQYGRPQARDILRVTERGWELQGLPAPIAWEEVDWRQIRFTAERYLMEPQRQVRLRDRAEQLLNLAILSYENDDPDDARVKQRTAVHVKDDMIHEFRRLLPLGE